MNNYNPLHPLTETEYQSGHHDIRIFKVDINSCYDGSCSHREYEVYRIACYLTPEDTKRDFAYIQMSNAVGNWYHVSCSSSIYTRTDVEGIKYIADLMLRFSEVVEKVSTQPETLIVIDNLL